MAKKKTEEVTETVDTTDLVSIKDIIENGYNLIDVKRYVPLGVKWQIIDEVINTITDVNEQGMLEIDYKAEKIMFDLSILKWYSNINLNDIEIDELYNEMTMPRIDLEKGGIIDYIYHQIIDGEIEFIKDCIDKTIKQKINLTNSLESVVNRNMKQFSKTVEEIADKLINAVPTEKGMKSIIKQISKFDPEKSMMIQSMVDAINGKTKSTNTDIPKMTQKDKDKLAVVK